MNSNSLPGAAIIVMACYLVLVAFHLLYILCKIKTFLKKILNRKRKCKDEGGGAKLSGINLKKVTAACCVVPATCNQNYILFKIVNK